MISTVEHAALTQSFFQALVLLITRAYLSFRLLFQSSLALRPFRFFPGGLDFLQLLSSTAASHNELVTQK